MNLGPVIFDLVGTELSPIEKEMLQHPAVGGVILFARNFESPEQLTRLVSSIKQLRDPALQICVDQEGGRVQRFRNGFTRLPDFRSIGRLYDENPEASLKLAWACGYVMAKELSQCGIDFSLSPVLDIDRGLNEFIGERSYHSDKEVITTLASYQMQGMTAANMTPVIKHFPGHSGVSIDTHLDLASDQRHEHEIMADDLYPFHQLFNKQSIVAVLLSHVIFPNVDEKPVGYSHYWLQKILREKLNFQGLIISDDLNMHGAKSPGNLVERALVAIDAGCDKILVCSQGRELESVLDAVEVPHRQHPFVQQLYGPGPASSMSQEHEKQLHRARELISQITYYAGEES